MRFPSGDVFTDGLSVRGKAAGAPGPYRCKQMRGRVIYPQASARAVALSALERQLLPPFGLPLAETFGPIGDPRILTALISKSVSANTARA